MKNGGEKEVIGGHEKDKGHLDRCGHGFAEKVEAEWRHCNHPVTALDLHRLCK